MGPRPGGGPRWLGGVGLTARHSRDDWDWSDDRLEAAARRLDRWRGAARGGDGTSALDEVRACLDRDLDTPSALAAVDEAADAGRDVAPAAALLGVAL